MRRRVTRRRALAVIAALLGLLAGLLVLPPLAAGQEQRIEVELTEFSITPNSITVTAGEPVTFVVSNTGGAPHNLEFELEAQGLEQLLFDTNLQPGETREATVTFDTPGEWVMYCPVGNHRAQGMEGRLIVQAAGTPTPTTAPAATPTPAVTPTPAATPTAAATPAPAVTPTPAATPTAAPARTPTATPMPQVAPPTGGGTGSGPAELIIAGLLALGLVGVLAGLAARRRVA